jgi:YidC/Oxa1 family membrane protein insertase
MDNKTLLAIVLSLAVIIGYQFFAAQQAPPPVERVEKSQEPLKAQAPAAVVPEGEFVPSAGEKEIRVENQLYSAVLSTRGGTIKYWEIKAYKDKIGKEVILLKPPTALPALGIGESPEFNYSHVNFSASGQNLSLYDAGESGSIVFQYSQNGVSIRRTYTFYSDTYKVDLTDEVSGLPEYWITLGSDFGIFEKEDGYTHVGPVLLHGTDLEELKEKKLAEPKIFRENLKWIGQEDKYFFSGLVPETKVEEARAWIYENSSVIAFKAAPGVHTFHLYAGPKEHDRLESLNLGLEHIIDFGFFSIIARPLFWVLKFFYSFLGNYGWAIIFLTIVVRIPFIPLVNKGQKSMKRLQELQPKMSEIKEKYKKDPQKMQKEMMDLYKKHKVSPMGGCLPMVLQIPVFFALYKVLLISIELRGAPFMLWITDLSAKDPYYILPVIMGVTMVIQQKMTPTSMDPKQAKIMMFMPIIFTFMFLNFASGLVLYWMVNNLLSIVQQFFVNRKLARQQA